MILQLDIGNTRIKWRVVENGTRGGGGAMPSDSLQELPLALAEVGSPAEVWVSSVADPQREALLQAVISEHWGVEAWFARTPATQLGLRNSYRDPARMGVDRWLAMLAAWRSVNGAVCVVDAGSALTIDFVAAAGEHVGGYILPGLDSMERALLSDTDRVRFGEAPRDRIEPGRSTEAAVFNGLLLSQAGAVSLSLQRLGAEFVPVFTGGNGELLKQLLVPAAEFRAELVLDGLALAAGARGGVQ